jgi:hypothetical protein
VFDVTTFILSNQSGIPASLLQEVGKHGLLHSSNALASHIQNINKVTQQTQVESDAQNEVLNAKHFMQKSLQAFSKDSEDKHIAKHGQGFSKLLQNNAWKGYSQTGISL